MSSLFSTADTGLKVFHSRMNKSYDKTFDIKFGQLIPFMMRFVLPGDVWRVGADVFIRYQPMLSPTLTRSRARMRYFFVPLRLVEALAELIITGSKNGKLYEDALPTFETVLDFFSQVTSTTTIAKHTLLDYMEHPTGTFTLSKYKQLKSAMAAYWVKAYYRIYFDYYQDENLQALGDGDFETYLQRMSQQVAGQVFPLYVNVHKDYFMSSLPFQLKGVAPTFNFAQDLNFAENVAVTAFAHIGVPQTGDGLNSTTNLPAKGEVMQNNASGIFRSFNSAQYDPNNKSVTSVINSGGSAWQSGGTMFPIIDKNDLNHSIQNGQGSFNIDDIRTMVAQTTLFERLARCGSRYTEYLRANFQVAPLDGTLQRAQYLGGFSQPIVVSEIAQTAEDGDNPVGTLRGKGISYSQNRISTHRFNEFGMIFGLMDIQPDTVYTQGLDREYTYKSRFDFFNPGFQHLSEQEIRNGEIFLDDGDHNDDTFGFTEYANELRISQSKLVGDMRDSLSYWSQPIHFSQRPNLNSAFISTASYSGSSWMNPFVVKDTSTAYPIIAHVHNSLDLYRPMVKRSTPSNLAVS